MERKNSGAEKWQNYCAGLIFPLQTPTAQFIYGMGCLCSNYENIYGPFPEFIRKY